MKNILMILWYYPPISCSGTERNLILIKNLFKYKVIIASTNALGIIKKEKDVYRISDFYTYYLKFFNKKKLALPEIGRYHTAVIKKDSFLKQVFLFFEKNIFIPDFFILSIPFFLIKCIYIIKKEKIDLIYTSCPPHSLHIVGYCLKLFLKIKWITDFRDGWLYEPLTNKKGFVRILEKWLEKRIVNKADAMITVSKPLTDYLKQEYKKENVFTVYKGYKEIEKESVVYRKNNNKLSIVYTGSFNASRQGTNPFYFFKAIKRLIMENKINGKKIKIVIAGKILDHEIEKMDKIGLNDIIEYKGLISNKEARNLQKTADILLLITQKGKKSIITGKLFEYIEAGRMIFALAKNNEASKIIKMSNIGECASPDNINDIKRKFNLVYQKWIIKQEIYKPVKEKLELFSTRENIKKFKNIIEGI